MAIAASDYVRYSWASHPDRVGKPVESGWLLRKLEADARVRRGEVWADWLNGPRAFWSREDSARVVEKP